MILHTELARRAVATGTLGAVAAGARSAAAIGTAALLQGGNAFDAAVAAALAETVLLPSKCGLAGDVVALYVTSSSTTTADPGERGETAGPTSLLSIGLAPAGLYDAAAATGWAAATTGPLSVGVPGAPVGYAALAARGRLGLPALVQPAIDLARRGVIWSAVNVRLAAESAALLARHQPGGCRYAPAGGPIRPGASLALPGLADLLGEFAATGANLFAGSLGDIICDYVTAAGGVLTPADLVPMAATQRAADRIDVGGTPVWATHSPTYGPALLEAVRTGVSADSVRIAMERIRAVTGKPAALADGTSTVAAADADGNLVVLVHSNSFPQYGSGLVVPGLDLVLSNRAGRGFTFEPDHPNAPVPGSRPPTTLHAWALRDADDSWVLGATPGGEQQVPWNAQILERVLRPSLDAGAAQLASAVAAQRWELTASGQVAQETVELPAYGARSSHTIVRRGRDGALTAVADPRGDAAAIAA
jgi:gamma-glutamyltranspeptidase/glutathione hydrolase